MSANNRFAPTARASLRQATDRPLTGRGQSRMSRSAGQAILGAAALCGPLLAASSEAADSSASPNMTPPVSPAFQKPVWLTDCSLLLREGYDDNVYLSGVDKKYLPGAYTVPAGSVAALRDVDSFVTTVSPKVGVNFASLLGDQTVFQALSLSYVPDFVTYHGASTESYNAHRITSSIKGQTDDFSFNIDHGFNYINGSKLGQVYPGNLFNVYGIAALRERREQFQDKAVVTLQYDRDKWLVRAVESLSYYNLLTEKLAGIAGYMNYPDRYDVNGGGDFGYKITSDAVVTVGYRYGHQYQQKFSSAIDPYGFSSTSDYQRALLGFEGKPWSWLNVKLQGGPDFRRYAESAPVPDRDPIKYYGEAALAATVTPEDSLTFKYRQFQWVSGIGRTPYFDSTYDLAYARKLTSKLSLSLGARALASDYTVGETTAAGSKPSAPKLTTNPRDDLQYSLGAGLRYAFTPNLTADVAYSCDLGRNAQDDVANPQTREYNHQVVSLGLQFKF